MPFLFSESGDAGGHITLVTSDQVPITFRLDDAGGSSGYVPDDPLAWNVPPPDNTTDALDQVTALPRSGWGISPALAGASPQFFETPVTPVKSGRFLVWVQGGGLLGMVGARVQVVTQVRANGALVNDTRVESWCNDNENFGLAASGMVVVDRTIPCTLGGHIAWQFGAVSNGYVRVLWWEL
jgi:hypothetical protein